MTVDPYAVHRRGTTSELGYDRAICVECEITWPCSDFVKETCARQDLAHGLPCNCGWHEEKVARDLEQEKEPPVGMSGRAASAPALGETREPTR